MMSQRVWAKILEFVFGRSIATDSLEEAGIVVGTRVGIHNFDGQSSRKFSFRLTAGPEAITLRKEPAESR